MLDRKVKETGEELELRVSGQVRLGNLIAYDTKTNTLWLQETGKALEGPQKGKTLPPLDESQWKKRVRWDEWRKEHPNSLVMVCDHCGQR